MCKNLVQHIFLLLLFILYGCNTYTPPKAPISEDAMVNLLVCIHINESKALNTYLPADTQRLYYKTLADTMWKKSGYNQALYDSSYKIYVYDVKAINRIYARVIDTLSLKEALKKL